MITRQREGLSLIVSVEVTECSCVHARSTVTHKLVQYKLQEEGSAVAYGEIVAENKLTSRSVVLTDNKRCSHGCRSDGVEQQCCLSALAT